MRALVTEIIHAFLSVPLLLVVLLAVLTFKASRPHAEPGLRRWRLVLLALAIGLYGVSAPIVSNALVHRIESSYALPALTGRNPSKAPVILVLTAGWLRSTENGYESKISEAGWERTWTAVQLWKQIGGTVIFTGAPTPDGRDSAAAGMARVAQQLGVPAAAVRVESASINTYENFLFSKPFIGKSGDELWLITGALQMPRAMAVAKHLGMSAIAYPCDFRAEENPDWRFWLPSNAGPMMLEEALHELLGRLQYSWIGRT